MKSVNFTSQTLGEEIANAVSHGVGALLSVAGCAVLIVIASLHSTALGIVSASLYGASLIILYTFSSLYHSITNEKAKKILQIFDHCSIFLLILGTYIPVSLMVIKGAWGWIFVGINTICAVVGTVFNAIDVKRWHKLSLILYVIMGWIVVVGLNSVIRAVSLGGIALLAGGGAAYSLGIIFYKNKTIRYMHFIWHLFVLIGSVLQYFFVLNYCF